MVLADLPAALFLVLFVCAGGAALWLAALR